MEVIEIFDEKIKIRVSLFIKETIDRDAKAFNFVKENGEANCNSFLNKLIPNLLKLNKSRREAAEKEKVNATLRYLSYDSLCFGDRDNDKLTQTLWIRPSTENLAVFDEIADSETRITGQDLSSYIRNMLDEYANLLEFKREQIVFLEEGRLAISARESGRILKFRYENELKRTYVFACVYSYLNDQGNYLLCYDMERKIICRYQLCEIRTLHLIKEKYKPSEILAELCKKYEAKALWLDDEIIECEGA